MKVRNIVWLVVALAGAVAGAAGTRLFISAPDIYHVADVPFLDLIFAIPCFLLFAWVVVAIFGKHSLLIFYIVVALGIYGALYGLFELVFHAFNHRPALSSLALFLFGLTILTSCYVANRLFAGRLRLA